MKIESATQETRKRHLWYTQNVSFYDFLFEESLFFPNFVSESSTHQTYYGKEDAEENARGHTDIREDNLWRLSLYR